MGFFDELRRFFGGNSIAATPAPARTPKKEPPRIPCPACGSIAPTGSASGPELVPAVAAEVLAYEDDHPDESYWDFGAGISRAHGFSSVFDVTDEVLRLKERRDRDRQPRVSKKTVDVDALRLLDLRHLDSIPLRLRGLSHYVTDRGRSQYGDTELVLKREPNNRHDTFAIAVYGKGRKVGYVSKGRANLLTPLLDRLDYDGFIVEGAVEQSPDRMTQLQVMLPRVPELRALVKEHIGDARPL